MCGARPLQKAELIAELLFEIDHGVFFLWAFLVLSLRLGETQVSEPVSERLRTNAVAFCELRDHLVIG